jgi:NAD(P)-dependent dehydrogenase (short-subunit alcohol dehydrogenase family)
MEMNRNSHKTERYSSPVKAILTGVSDLFKGKDHGISLKDLPSLEGKKVLITGASSGLGFASAVELAGRGAHVIMAVRSGIPHKGEEVKKISGSAKVEMIQVDLSDLGSLRSLSKKIKEQFGLLDLIICNAAMVAKRSRPVSQGLDEMFVVNYFAKFLFINYLLEEGLLNHNGPRLPRIIIVASESHRNAAGFDWEGFGRYTPYGMKQSVAMYGYYKLLLLTMANELSRRLNPDEQINCSVFALCPGPVNSNIAREAPAFVRPLLKLVFGIFFRSPRKACHPLIYLAASGDLEGRTGTYMFLMQEKDMDEKARDPENGKQLWELSERLSKQIIKDTDG